MLNFNQRVQQFLKQHRENKKHAVIAVMLALIVAFSVCGSLIMPAVSMTGSTEETLPLWKWRRVRCRWWEKIAMNGLPNR